MAFSLLKSTWVKERLKPIHLNNLVAEFSKALNVTDGGEHTVVGSAVKIIGLGLDTLTLLNHSGSQTKWPFTSARTGIVKTMSLVGMTDAPAVIVPGVVNDNIAASGNGYFPFHIPDEAVITGAIVNLERSAGSPATAEATISVRSVSATGTVTTIGSQAASAGSGATVVTLSGLNQTYTSFDTSWLVQVAGETGAGAGTIRVTRVAVVYTISGLPLVRL